MSAFAKKYLVLITAALIALAAGTEGVRKEGRFWVCETPHYQIKTDVSEAFAQDLADQMELCYASYSKYTRGKPKFSGRSVVLVYKRQQDFMANIRGMNQNVAGCYSPDTKVLASFLEGQGEDGLFETLRHEGFHQFFDKYVGQNRPIWLDEGLAGYFEKSFREGKEFRHGIVTKADVALVQQAFKGEKLNFISMRDLMLMDHSTWSRNVASRYDKARLQYLEARLLVQFLLSRKDYTRMLDAYILACSKGMDLEQGLRVAFGDRLEGIAKAWTEFMRELKPNIPESCTVNLMYLGTLLQIFSKYGKIDSPAALHAAVMSNKDVQWYIREIGGGPEDKITQANLDIVEKWFHCPKEKPGKNPERPTSYEFVKSESKVGLPDILCRNHAPVFLRAVIVPGAEPGKNRTLVKEEPIRKKP